MTQDDQLESLNDMFQEPADFRPESPKAKRSVFDRFDGSQLVVNLVGYHSLWAHYAWNAGIYIAKYIDSNPDVVRGKKVLELGAGAAFPSIVSALNNASQVVVTDYPDIELIQQLSDNVLFNLKANTGQFQVTGHLWGKDETWLDGSFDVVILCDLIFNHNQHRNMLVSCQRALQNKGGIVLCAFTHHRPWLADRDMEFIALAQSDEFRFKIADYTQVKMPEMFTEDPGDVDVRQTVHFYTLTYRQ
ncbi:hypothetical protein MIR68_007808 [Amoeboaphelidium protococcarum]|nr:hypothetical protein MIR68_007808 [Amoeboaphelidium protococcarum]